MAPSNRPVTRSRSLDRQENPNKDSGDTTFIEPDRSPLVTRVDQSDRLDKLLFAVQKQIEVTSNLISLHISNSNQFTSADQSRPSSEPIPVSQPNDLENHERSFFVGSNYRTPCARPGPVRFNNNENILNIGPHRDLSLVQPHLIPINQINPDKFNGERSKARVWLKNYEDTMNINHYDDAEKLVRARAYLLDEASHWYSTTLCLEPDLNWCGFKDFFLRHFCGSDRIAELRKKLSENKQKPYEHPSTFLVRTTDLCLQFKPHMSHTELTDRVVSGLRGDVINLLIASKPQTEWTIKWLRSVFEGFKQESNHMNNQSNIKKHSTNTNRQSNKTNLSTWTCFNCLNKGHLIENCPEPKDVDKIKRNTEEYRQKKHRKGTRESQETSKDTPVRNVFASDLQRKPRSFVNTPLPGDDVETPRLTINVNGSEIIGRIDSGADITLLPNRLAKLLKLNVLPWSQAPLKAFNNSNINPIGMAPTLISFRNIKKLLLMAVVPDSCHNSPLWGADLLKALEISMKYEPNGSISISVLGLPSEASPDVNVDQHTTGSTSTAKVANSIGELGPKYYDNTDLCDKMFSDFAKAFSQDENDLGRTSTLSHKITLSDDSPVHKTYYRVPIRHREELEKTIQKQLSVGAIRPSKSPYASPVFFVDKDQGQGKRLVADYRALNSKTIPDRTPMPRPDDVTGLLAGMKLFAKFDITSMFNQIPVAQEDIHKTAIITPFGLFECPLMPFGLINAPATAVRLMREVLRDLDGKICSVYFDDIIIFARDINELIQRCMLILGRLISHNIKLKPSKCKFALETIPFLGFIISGRGIEIDKRRFESVLNFPVPRNHSNVRSFHGLCNFNRKFIKNFADLAKPLTPLMSKNTKFKWTIEAQESFDRLKKALSEAPTLVHFNPEATHELRTDASSYAIGAILYQIHPSDESQSGVVLYYSKTLNAAQRNYSATKRELLAAYYAITDLKHYLCGKRFTLVTDHAALSLLRSNRDPHHTLARWVAELQAFDFNVTYKKGSTHLDADCLSRLVEDNITDNNLDSNQLEAFRTVLSLSSQDQGNDTQPLGYDLGSEQRNDPFCSKYIDILESTELSAYEKSRRARRFTLQDNLLYLITMDDNPLLVIPEQRRSAVLLSSHDSPLAGHFGFSRTYSLIKSRYFWPKMRRDVKKYVASCPRCQMRKIRNTRLQGFTKPLPIAENVFDTLGIDLLSKLPKSNNGFTAVLVATDNLSKYVVAIPLKDERAETIVHAFFNNVVAKYGCPKLVISDRGSNISGERSRDFFRLFGIKRALCSSYHPQSNGQTERFNRTLAVSLSTFVERNQRDWPDFLQAIVFAYNISEHSVTRISPFELVFGRRPRLPLDNLLERSEFVDPTIPMPYSISDKRIAAIKRFIEESQQANKRRLDGRLLPSNYEEGDLVLLARPTRIRGASHKLTNTYIGPFQIKKKISDLSFEISGLAANRARSAVVHPCHLRKFIPRDNVVTDDIINPTFIPREPNDEPPLTQPIRQDQPQPDLQSDSDPPLLSGHEIDTFSPDITILDHPLATPANAEVVTSPQVQNQDSIIDTDRTFEDDAALRLLCDTALGEDDSSLRLLCDTALEYESA